MRRKRRSNVDMQRERFINLFWLLFAVYVSIESYRLDLGTWGMPGPGYFPFGASLLLGIISLSTFVNSLKKAPSQETAKGPSEPARYQNVALILVAMIVYFFLLNRLGFVLCTSLFSLFFLRIVMSRRWFTALAVTISVTLALHLLFNIFLNAQLPPGIFRLMG